jgi:peptidoglycan-associated lipoprotein
MFMLNSRKIVIVWATIFLMVFAAGCKKKIPPPPPPPPPVQPAPPPPPPPPAAPVIAQFAVDPATIQRGQSSNLSWRVTGTVTNVSINQGIGAVQNSGSQRVYPNDSTTYTLTVTGPGGNATRSATVTVTVPPPPPPPPMPPPKPTIEQRIFSQVSDAFFDYDKSELRADARDALARDAGALKSILADFPNATIAVEGHCDERGSAEYNIGLGDRRSNSAKDLLVQLGVPSDRLKTISYGKERPQCTESNESCWQKNRRVHFSPAQ